MDGRTFTHPKADAAATPARSAGASVPGRMFLAVIVGGFLGLLFSILIAPDFALAFAIGGAMSFAAGAALLVLTKSDDTAPTGNARSEEEVRQALAEIEARK